MGQLSEDRFVALMDSHYLQPVHEVKDSVAELKTEFREHVARESSRSNGCAEVKAAVFGNGQRGLKHEVAVARTRLGIIIVALGGLWTALGALAAKLIWFTPLGTP